MADVEKLIGKDSPGSDPGFEPSVAPLQPKALEAAARRPSARFAPALAGAETLESLARPLDVARSRVAPFGDWETVPVAAALPH